MDLAKTTREDKTAEEIHSRLQKLRTKLRQHREAVHSILAGTIGRDANGGRDMYQDPLGATAICDVVSKRILREIQQVSYL